MSKSATKPRSRAAATKCRPLRSHTTVRSPIAQHLRAKGHGVEKDKKKQDSKYKCRTKLLVTQEN